MSSIPKVKFRKIHEYSNPLYSPLYHILKSNKFQYYNTIIDPDFKKEIKNLFMNINKMSTLANIYIINSLVKTISEGIFLNIGTYEGFSYLGGSFNNPHIKSIGVDNFSEFDKPRNKFYKNFEKYKHDNNIFYDMDYVDYFNNIHEDKIGLYIYDANHSYKDQLKGLELAEKHFIKNTIVIIDDTNWDAPYNATMEFINKSKNKYKILMDTKTQSNGHPTYWNGLLIFQKE